MWGWGNQSHAYINIFYIKQFQATVQFLCAQYIFFLPHQSYWNLFNTGKCFKEEIQFQPQNCTHPGEQVVSYLINYWGLISLPNGCHLLQYWNWNSKRESPMDSQCVCEMKNTTWKGTGPVSMHSESGVVLFHLKLQNFKSHYFKVFYCFLSAK